MKSETTTLKEILEYYGMPKENIDAAVNQINQTYGANRYLDGVKNGVEAVDGLTEEVKSETANAEHADNSHDGDKELPMDGDGQEYHEIGETFEFEGHKLTTIGCKGNDTYTCINVCFFRNSERCESFACCVSERVDRNSVYFSEVDEKGDTK